MMVSTGAEWFTDKGDKRSYSISLDEDDLTDLHGADYVSGLSFNDKRKALNAACDSLVVAYMAKEGAISMEYATKRIEELRNG